MRAWRPMLRLARRDAMRARGRSILVLVMIALPVLAVTAADIVTQTADVSGAESLGRELGAADAEIRFQGVESVQQAPDPNDGSASAGVKATAPPTLATVRKAIGRPVRGIERREGGVRVSTDKGVASAEGTEVDLRDPLSKGLFRLTGGRFPQKRGEVVVNAALADRGDGIGETVTVGQEATATVVGIAESTSSRNFPIVAGPLGSLGLPVEHGTASWLVDAGGPVEWRDVTALNGFGATVLSREVMEHPPALSEVPADVTYSSNDGTVAVVALITVMTLLEVVLLAGPAFAVGARRQQRNLALIAASGGTPRQMRRVVLASAVVLGGTAAAVGVALGIGLAVAVMPIAQHFSGTWFGPFDIAWLHLAGIAAFGLVSAFLAAFVPAAIAARQDVVKVLAGRRGDRKPGLRSPLLGLVLLGAGVTGAVYGAKSASSGELYIAASAVVSVLGMILLVPVVVAVLARVSGRLPLPMRYAVRDAARHRTRTVPAVAAVAATVVGVVALGIGASSDALERERTYTPNLPEGSGAVTFWGGEAVDWQHVEQDIRKALPANHVTAVKGIPEHLKPSESSFVELTFAVPQSQQPLLESYGSSFGSSVLVGDDLVAATMVDAGDDEREAARGVLARGGAVVMTDHAVNAQEVRISAEYWADDGTEEGAANHKVRPLTVPALYVKVPGSSAPYQAVVSPRVAERMRLASITTALYVDGPIRKSAEADITEAVGATDQDSSFYVERGYQTDDQTTIALIVLAALGGVLMLGGTLTATFLALSDARPDLATLSAIGAAPRTRRGVAAAYAGIIGLVGAALGAAVGFVPGIAVTYPLTGVTWTKVDAQGQTLPDHFLDIPWLLVGTVVLFLPLLTALVVGVTARSRLPQVARID